VACYHQPVRPARPGGRTADALRPTRRVVVVFANSACRPRLEALQDRVLRARRRCCPVDLSSPAAEQVIYHARLVGPARCAAPSA
jgi:hypothetical protein